MATPRNGGHLYQIAYLPSGKHTEYSKLLPETEGEATGRFVKLLPEILGGLSIMRITREQPLGDRRVDLVVEVRAGPLERSLVVEVKRIGEPRFAREAIFQLQTYVREVPNAYPVLAAPYLTESTRKMCKEAGVGYFDLAGNVYLRFDNVLVDRTTPLAIRQERKTVRSLSSPKVSQVIRAMLSQPKRIYRVTELAKASRVSPAQAYKVANLLELKGFARRDPSRKVVLTKPGGLLEAWASSLDFKRNRIAPSFSLERTPEAVMKAIAKAAGAGKRPYALTMFAGASLIAPFTRFYDVTFYIEDGLGWWMDRLDLKEVETGSNLQLVVPRDPGVFTNAQVIRGYSVVSNIQLYADLLTNPARGREQAETIRRKKIGF